MKKILLLILLLSCNKIMGLKVFKNKDINEDLVLAIINNETDKAIELIKQGADVYHNHESTNVLELVLDKRNLDVLKILLKKEIELSKDNTVKIYDLALDDFNYDIIDLIKDKYKLEEALIDKNKYFLLLCYTSNATEVRKFIEKNNINPKEIKDKFNRDGLIISAVSNKMEVIKMLIEEYHFDINSKNNNGITSLMAACNQNNKETVELLIERGANVNDKEKDGWPPLMLASENGHTEIAKLLIDRGANVNKREEDKWTSLMIASQNGHAETLKLLIDEGANVNDKNNNGWTALMVASQKGHTETVKLLIDMGANVNDKNNDSWTALMISSQKGHTETVKLLLEKGAGVNYKNNNGKTALMIASQKGHTETLKLLIDRGASVNEREENKEWTALMIASQKGHAEIIKLLIDTGANVKDKNNNGCTALMIATQNGHTETLKLLIDGGANVNEREEDGWTSLMIASQNGHIETLKLLIDGGANVNEREEDEWTPLMIASQDGHTETVKLLLEKGAGVNDKNNNGLTALMIASQEGHTETVKLLIDMGASANEREEDKEWTSLMVASQKGHTETVKLLIDMGANVNDKNNDSWTALMIASQKGHTETLKLLIDEEANVNEREEDEWTALMIASYNGHIETVKLLVDRGAIIDERVGYTWLSNGKSALTLAHEKNYKEIIELLLSKGADTRGIKDIILEDILINNIKNNKISNCLIMIKKYGNKINYKYKDEKNNNFLHYAASTSNILLFEEFLNKGCDINFMNSKNETPLYKALCVENINEDFILYLIGKEAILSPRGLINGQELITILLPYEKLFSNLILEPLAKKMFGKFVINNEDKNILKELKYILNLKDEDFGNEKEMINYIKNVFLLKNGNLNLILEEIENIKIGREDLVDFDLDADYILGAAFDLGQDEYYGNEDNGIENIRETFKHKLIDIVQTKAPKAMPSEDATDHQKAQYVKYLTKKRLRLLSLRLSGMPENQRKENLGWVMNNILTNLSCHTGTLVAINHAVNCLLGNDNEVFLKDIINKELMLYRISLLEETAIKHLDNKCTSIMLDEMGREAGRDKGLYTEHMKAYLVMDLYEELKVTGLYEKDFKYIYDKALVIKEVKRLYKERALDYIVKHIRENRSLNNKVIEYLEKDIFKNRKLEREENPTVFHIENFIYDEDLTSLTKEAIIALLIHFKLLK